MPIPKPSKGQKKDNFISSCMRDDKMNEEYKDPKQRFAVCSGAWLDRFSNNIGKSWNRKRAERLADDVRNIHLKLDLFAGEKVSIDFDETLNTERGKELAKRLLSEGKDLHIVTRRQERTASKEVYDVAKEVGIDRNKIHFTNGQLKWKTLQRLGIITHYDNNLDEINAIKINTKGIRAIKFKEDVPHYTKSDK